MEAKYTIKNGVLSLAPPGTEANITSAWFSRVNLSDPPFEMHGFIDYLLPRTEYTETVMFNVLEPDKELLEACFFSTQTRGVFALKIEL